MTIKAGGCVALIAATGLLVGVCGVSWTVAASAAVETKSEYVSTSNKVKQVRYYKRYAHRKYARTAQKSSEEQKPVEIAETGRVTGNITTDSLVIAKGGFFNGNITKMENAIGRGVVAIDEKRDSKPQYAAR